jgi:hypothetical protein
MVSNNDESYVLVSDEANHSSLGSFDHKHLQRLSRQFIDSLRFPGLTIERAYLRKLLERALQIDPYLRPSQITLIPRMFDKEYVEYLAMYRVELILTYTQPIG